jgi:hypothetical protein
MRIRTGCCLLSIVALLLAVGCNEVEDRLSWSPDGTRAILRLGNDLCLVDTNGNLSAPLLANVTAAAWLPDSRGLIVIRRLTVDTWQDLESLLSSNEIASVETVARGYLAFCAGGGADSDQEFFDQFEMKRPELASPAILYLFDTRSTALREALQTAKDPGKLEGELSNLRTTKVAEVSVLLLADHQTSGSPRPLERTLADLQQPRPSPSAPVVAFLRGESLMVAPLDGGTNRVSVAEKVEGVYDWTPDGKSLVYAVRLSESGSSDINLARIERRIVVDANGALVEGDILPLALSSSGYAPRLKCLPDGRVLFAGFQQQLPAPALATRESRFFWIDPAQGTNAVPVAIPSAAGALPQDLAAFAPSPDGRQIAIVESGSDVVAVLDVATGTLEVVSPKRGWKSRVLPAWRGADELYFAALPDASSTRPELLRWRKGSTPQVVSRSWTDGAVGSLLEKPGK